MVQKLTELELLDYEKYGIIRLTEAGEELGEFLLERHMIIERFLTNLGVQDSLLIETEMIEHNVSITTLDKIDKLNQFFQDHPELHQQFLNYPPEE